MTIVYPAKAARDGRSWRVRTIATAALFAAAITAPAASACGYENPDDIAPGLLNWAYPKALYVRTAVWMAQQKGIIGRVDQSHAMQSLLGYQRAVVMLGALREHLSGAHDGNATPAFSLVFIRPMLWSRYEAAGGAVNMTAHLAGPADGDVVIVSDEPVIAGLLDGRLTPARAREFGLMRLYGAPAQVQDVVNWLDRSWSQSRSDATKVGH